MSRKAIKLGLAVSGIILFSISACKNPRKSYKKTDSGLKYYFIHESPESKTGEVGDIYILNTEFRNMKDSVFLSLQTNFKRNVDYLEGGFPEGVSMLHKGDSASFIVNADTFYKDVGRKKPEALIGQNQLKINVGVVDILTPKEFNAMMLEKEQLEIDRFVARKGWNVITDTASGIRYEITTKNPEGQKIKFGDEVGITYFYYTLNEKPFAKIKDGDLMRVQVGDQSRIAGISKALSFTREGEFIRAILPYSQAFGEDGFGVHVPGYTTLVIELDVVTLESSASAAIELLN